MKRENLQYSEQNIVLMMPMHSDYRNREIWQRFSEESRTIRFINTSLVFYNTEESMKMPNKSQKLIEIFALNYLKELRVHVSNIDVANSI